jgi:hypothetical protein
LNSERIRQEFGSFGIDVVESGEGRRISSMRLDPPQAVALHAYVLPVTSALAGESTSAYRQAGLSVCA